MTVTEWDARSVRQLGQQLSNWGRWGPDDERGTLNFITPDRVLAACSLPRSGRVISCALPFDQNGPPLTGVREGTYLPSPGAAAPLPTDVNIDGIQGDAHPYLWAGWVLRR